MREKELIKKSYDVIGYYTGYMAIGVAMMLLLPLVLLPFFPEESSEVEYFFFPALISAALGAILVTLFRKTEKITLTANYGSIVILIAWAYASIMGAMPFLISGKYTLLQSLFESISGWTTTGLTVTVPEQAPKLFLMWRSLMQYIGGGGFVMAMFAFMAGPSASPVLQLEGHTEDIIPQLRYAARLVLGLYITYLALGIGGYLMAGMNIFDSVNHAMSAVSTGGFSTKNASIGSYNSIPIEIVSIILMILGGMNFVIAYYLIRGRFRTVLKNAEIKTSIVVLVLFSAIFLLIRLPKITEFALAFWGVLFEGLSFATTTGFTLAPGGNFTGMLPFVVFLSIILMNIGGHSSSTAGGIKQLRLYLGLKSVIWLVREQFFSKNSVFYYTIYRGKDPTPVKEKHFHAILSFLVLYLLFLFVGTAVLTSYGNPIDRSLFEFSSALSTSGQTAGITTPDAPPAVLITLIAGMLFGRLEFFIIIIAIAKMIRDADFMASESD